MSSTYRPDRRRLVKHSAAATALMMAGGHLPAFLSSASAQLARNETLYIVGTQWGPPSTFNPLSANIAWPVNTGSMALIYQPLFGYNSVAGEIQPMLAESLEFDEMNSVTVTLFEGTTWHDGTPLTSEDVVYTYSLAEKYPAVPFATASSYLNAPEAVDDRTILFPINQENLNIGMIRTYLSQVQILPKHIWEEREAEDIVAYIDLEPIGSGPFTVSIASPEQIVVERFDGYWGAEVHGTPTPKYVAHPIPKSNDDANLAFQRGEVDLSGTFLPQVWKMWEDQDLPVKTWFREQPYHLPNNIAMAFLNIHRPGLDNPLVRKALAHAINYAQIAETAVSNYANPMNASLLVPGTAEDAFYDQTAVDATGWTYNPERAIEILENEAGATKGDDGVYVLPDGTRLGPWGAMCPYGWTDWMTSLEVVAQGAREIGIEITTDYPESPVFYDRLRSGDFDIAMMTQFYSNPAGTWQRYREVFDDRGVPAIGDGNAFWNYNRYQNEDALPLLDDAAVADDAALKDIYQQLDEFFRTDVPVIPLIYQPLQMQANESVWQGFPSSDDPHSPPSLTGAGVHVLSRISLAGE